MVIEIANFQVVPGKSREFLNAMDIVTLLLSAAEGYRGHTVGLGVEAPGTATLIVMWRSYADHVERFEPSTAHEQFMAVLDGLHEGEVSVAHVETRSTKSSISLPVFQGGN